SNFALQNTAPFFKGKADGSFTYRSTQKGKFNLKLSNLKIMNQPGIPPVLTRINNMRVITKGSIRTNKINIKSITFTSNKIDGKGSLTITPKDNLEKTSINYDMTLRAPLQKQFKGSFIIGRFL
ncbi:MAG: hypothetical protein ABEJ65_12500, partial [bacterium]